MTSRRCGVLIAGLGSDSALAREVRGGWSDALELAAAQVEISHAQLRAQLKAGGVKRSIPPLKIKRPRVHSKRSGRRHGTMEEIAALLEGMG